MGPPRGSTSRKQSNDSHDRERKKDKKKSTAAPFPRRKGQDPPQREQDSDKNKNQIDISDTIPLTLQQLLLNVFKSALLSGGSVESDTSPPSENGGAVASPPKETVSEEQELDIKSLVQTIKSHLYNRDFDSAFTDANEDLLRAYALRWSAARALGYAGLFKSLLKGLPNSDNYSAPASMKPIHVVCIGGGAGAEIVALAGAWRDLMDEADRDGNTPVNQEELSDALDAASLNNDDRYGTMITPEPHSTKTTRKISGSYPALSITTVDIADWSSVVSRLSSTILSPAVPSSKTHPAPLLLRHEKQYGASPGLTVDFKRLDILSTPDEDFHQLFRSTSPSADESRPATTMVTLMFTLNELFSTSMAKATAFLLRTTDLLQPGTLLLVVDSPGSYSTLKLGKAGKSQDGEGSAPPVQERQYPMKFLLDHALLSVAKGKWEQIYSQDSRWWRRDAARLWYDVGEGVSLEDMRFQIHVYRRLG